MISEFFIKRPIFASVLSILIFLAGVISIFNLPIEQYPNILPPQVVISATYPGASADIVATTVAAPIEQEINGATNMIYMQSASSNSGNVSITVTFAVGTDPEIATIDVNNRLQSAIPSLPAVVQQLGLTVEKRSSSILQVITMYSPTNKYDALYLSNYAAINVVDELNRVEGVGQATIFGEEQYSMRIWTNQDKLFAYNLTPLDIVRAVKEQNSQFAVGNFGGEPTKQVLDFYYSAQTQGRFETAEQFGNIIISSDNKGNTIYLKDVARVELGSNFYDLHSKFNSKTAIPIGIFLQPGANAIATTMAVAKKMAELSKNFPDGVAYSLPFDTTRFVISSIKDVVKTFGEAILLVTIVVFIFLQNARATLIPIIAIPISLVGTFAGMYALGFSINLLTLFGMVLAIGIVVDDAIVVLENFERIMRTEKLSPYEAGVKAMKEVTGPIIAIVLVLVAVFAPAAFLGGLTGEMYRQFAVTIAISVTISGFVAITLTPTLCVLMIRHQENHNKFFDWFTSFFNNISDHYHRGVGWILTNIKASLLLFVIIISATAYLVMVTPASLVPEEDQGYLLAATYLLPGSSLKRTDAVVKEINDMADKNPYVASTVSLAGLDILSFGIKSSAATTFIPLKDWTDRKDFKASSMILAKQFMGQFMSIKEAFTMVFNPPPITGISMTGGFDAYIQNHKSSSVNDLYEITNKFIEMASKRPELQGVQTTLSVSTPQYYLDLNREKAKALSVRIDDVYSTIQATLSAYYINDFTLFGRNYQVNLQSEDPFRGTPEDLSRVYIKSTNGNLVPCNSLVKATRIIGPDTIEHYNIFLAAHILGNPAPGYSSGQAIVAMEEVAAQNLPEGFTLEWTGSAYQEKVSYGSGTLAFGLGIVIVLLILSALYERWSLPFVVITAVPFGVFGAFVATWLRNLNYDLYLQVGLLVLIGLSAKNAILIVEFAVMEMEKGKNALESVKTAAALRFRPIVMTSLAFILGCVPLAISTGAGAASRHSIGTGVIGGMIAATFIATFFIPLFFVLILKMFPGKQQGGNI